MRKARSISLLVGIVLACVAVADAAPRKQAGIFYSTLYAKTCEPELLRGFAGKANGWFLADVNGDGHDDAAAYFQLPGGRGEWRVACFDGQSFQAPRGYGRLSIDGSRGVILMGDVNGDGRSDASCVLSREGRWHVSLAGPKHRFGKPRAYAKSLPAGADQHFLADVNGDGLCDAVCVASRGPQLEWSVALSSGDRFGSFHRVLPSFGGHGDACFLADVNGDRRADAITYDRGDGRWSVALASEEGFEQGAVWREGFGSGNAIGFVCDIDGDGKADAGYRRRGEWWVAYSDGKSFSDEGRRWIAGFGDRAADQTRNKQNPPPAVAFLTGSISGEGGCACVVDESGRWFVVSHRSRGDTLVLHEENTWASWRCSYLPQLPTLEGTYDSGDPRVQDAQLRMIHDAGFTYITLDITNGRQPWVDERARAFFERVREWNRNLRPGQHKMHANIALGRTRGVEGEDAFFDKLNRECSRAWDEFIVPYKDIYYRLDGKPLVIHMISSGIKEGHYKRINEWSGGDRTFIDLVACRWMTGWGGCTSRRANFYGWDVCEKFGNPVHPEMMPVMPGFWNGGSYVDREGGDFYRSQWMRVIQHQPDSVWVNSFNETWEHTSVEPSHMFNTRAPHRGITMWTDLYGDRMDDFYWLMTSQYMKLFMEGALVEGTYLQEYRGEGRGYGPVLRVGRDGFERQRRLPRRAPVLLLPGGFAESFSGRIVERPRGLGEDQRTP